MSDTMRLDDERDPLAEDDEVIDAADEDEEFEGDEEEDENEDEDEEEGDIEARHALTAEVASEGGSPGESTEILRPLTGGTRGSEASESMRGGIPARVVERRDEEGRVIKRAP